MRRLRVLCLMHDYLVPPEDDTRYDISVPWKTEFDVKNTLEVMGHEVRAVGVADDLAVVRNGIKEFAPHIVFNLMENFTEVGVFDQNIVSYLELLRVPYTGCNPRGLTLSRDKALSRKLLAYHRIPAPYFTVVPLNRRPVLPKKLQYPLIVKSLTYESSIGISQASVVANEEHLIKRVKYIHDTILTPAIIEQFIDGRELYVGVMGNHRLRVFPVWEMSFAKMSENNWRIATERVKWSVKYQKRHGIDTAEAQLPEGVAAKVQHLAKRAYRALELSGYARVDFRMDANNNPYVIEANANPQLAENEDFAQSAKRAKLAYPMLLERIMALGIQWQPHRMGL
jgi:D-alanine-D-alanine ligase